MRPLRILFLLRSFVYLRHFESTIRSLASQGHQFTILVSPDERKITPEMRDLAERLGSEFPGAIAYGQADGRRDRHRDFVGELRTVRDYLRYRTVRFSDASRLASRARETLSPLAGWTLDKSIFARAAFNRLVNRWLARVEAGVPPDTTILSQIKANAPDLVLATPLVDLESDQVDWIKAARALGIPTALPVASWDNLTNKGVIHAMPDRVIVWNEIQKREAIELHSVPAEAVEITGAQLYDQWFERRPSRDYETFCAELGLDPRRKTILYVGSTIFIVRDETQFVRRWIGAVRNDPRASVRAANVLVRPHPMHQAPFQTLDLSEFDNCAIHPRLGGMPVNETAKADYFDALYHCSAVVGINTSALVEASILGKRCLSVREPEFARTQEGTLHFHYLVDGGLMRLADSFPEHLDHLDAELSAPEGRDVSDIQGFVRDFIRPLGLDVAGTPRLAAVIEAAAVAGERAGDRAKSQSRFLAGPLLHWSLLSRSRDVQQAFDLGRSYRLLQKSAARWSRQVVWQLKYLKGSMQPVVRAARVSQQAAARTARVSQQAVARQRKNLRRGLRFFMRAARYLARRLSVEAWRLRYLRLTARLRGSPLTEADLAALAGHGPADTLRDTEPLPGKGLRVQ